MAGMNETHNPNLRSFVASSNAEGADFPLQNLPHGVFSTPGEGMRGGIAIGDQVLDLRAAVERGLFDTADVRIARAAADSSLNALMAMGNAQASRIRARLSALLREGALEQGIVEACLIPVSAVTMALPAHIGGFTDFCTSVPHAFAARPGRKPPPDFEAFRYMPIGYNSRASSVAVEGQPIPRPYGQSKDADGTIHFRPSRQMDYELEFGALIGEGNPLGQPIPMDEAPRHIWGYVLVNDWSARDIQRFESMLGPFLSKSFRTTISPWVVTQEAMAPFRVPANTRSAADPPIPKHLTSARHEAEGNLHLHVQALIRSAKMRARGEGEAVLTDSALNSLYWTLEQMVTHLASNGCNLSAGDLIGSGTLSGMDLHQTGCLLEMTGGVAPVMLPDSEKRAWLEDGDELVLRGRLDADGARSIGFGACGGEIVSPPSWPTVSVGQAS